MSSTYCIQLTQDLYLIAITTANPVNFTNLQFSLSVNSLVIFLFSKYPFNFGYDHAFCVNQDEFGFAQVGTTFNIDLTNYQGYYMLILIYPEGINLTSVGSCDIVPNLTMTFQNTTISPIESETIINNFDGQFETDFCACYQGQSHTIGTTCSNSNYVPAISLNNLNNQLVIITCQAFYPTSNTTVEFVTPTTCPYFGAYLTAEIIFIGNQQVIDFLNSNNISYSTISSTTCQAFSSISPCELPCRSVYQISQLLSPPLKYSLITSKLWNEIVNDLYLAYTIFKYINYLSQFPYIQNIYHAISDFYNFYENFQPYVFKPLIHARKGLPLTADYFNSLIDTIIELANFANIQLRQGISHVQPDQIVKSLQFDNIIYNVNQLLTFNYNQYFLLSCYGNEFNNLLSSITTFLNVLISNPMINITIPNNVYIKNFLIYNNFNTITIYGTIANLVMNLNSGTIQLQDFSSISFLVLQNNSGIIELNNESNIHNLSINQNPGTININNNSTVNTIQIQNNSGIININDNAIIENLICSQNIGTVNISSDAIVINNQCSS
ncbi:hypothetical protein [Sulfolobus islandicus rod-shaped virus 4]|uniref:Uncharacterized protein n=1 Tax=Sulfolobus islandicus rod-shaped virus 4 TaxID=1983547 RepID=A0A1X9SK01_9VIRU|nr:hypothetical protein CCL46_gp38 [Sulfolobus islandicus rod-shaped virus 4]ARQ96554.1 hypothetical protein [Sulfolobus islandicus rod-shaped virus 4]